LNDYRVNKVLGLSVPELATLLDNSNYTRVKEHFERISSTINNGSLYVETGARIFPWIPYLLKKYGNSIIVVHLVRHPFYVAFSLSTHNLYIPSRIKSDSYILNPSDKNGVQYEDYIHAWPSLNAVERALYQWLKINSFAEELKVYYIDNFITIRSEDLHKQPSTLIDALISKRKNLEYWFTKNNVTTNVVDTIGKGFYLVEDLKTLRYSGHVKELAKVYNNNDRRFC